MSDFQTVARADDVPTNSSIGVELSGWRLLVCNAGGEFYVIENRCSHQEKPLEGGRIRNGYIFCPVHGMRYKLDSGEGVGQLTRLPIKTFPTQVVDGEVQASLPNPS